MSAPPNEPAKPSIDVRTLSASHLQRLAKAGSRRAQAELDRRMQAAAAAAPAAVPAMPVPAAAPARPLLQPASTPPARDDDARLQHLQLIAQQEEAESRAEGPPRLVGLALIAWGVLLLFGGLVMLSYRGGGYYLACSVALVAVGALLMRVSRWALFLHAGAVLLALAWAWRASKGSATMTLVQAAPLWIPALWIAAARVREPLR